MFEKLKPKSPSGSVSGPTSTPPAKLMDSATICTSANIPTITQA